MKQLIATGFASLLLTGLISSVSAQNLYEDDLYGSPKKNSTKVSTQSTNTPSYTTYSSNRNKSTNSDDNFGDLVDSYNEALTRRVEAYQSDKSYPKEYWKIQEQFVGQLSKKYDKDLYNVIVINDKVWVEPSYITSMFDDSDPTVGINNYVKGLKDGIAIGQQNNVVNVNVNVDPWYSSWNSGWAGYYPYYRPYWGYRPWWGGGYYPPYWGGGYYPPYYRPYHNYPYWGGGGGYYRPYNGSSRSNGYYTGARSQHYERGSGFGRRDNVSDRRNTTSSYDRDNVKVYNSYRRPSNSSAENYPSQRPSQGGTSVYNRVERSGDNFRRIDPSRTNSYDRTKINTNTEQRRPTVQRTEPVTRPSYTPPVSRPSYTPPAGRQNGGGGGGGGGVHRR